MTRFLDAATRESDQRLGPYYRWVLRPASVPVATLFLSVGVTANQATLIGMAVGGCAAVLAAVGTPATLAWAGLLWQASRVLDLVDGNLARASGVKVWSGKFLDGLADALLDTAFLIGIGVGVGSVWGVASAVVAWFSISAALARMRLLYIQQLVQAVPGHTEAASDTPAYASLARQAVAGLEWLDRNAGLPGVVAAIALGAPLAWLLPTLALRSVLAFAGLGGAVWVGVHRLEVRRG
jgi:phosphatidylglycerophosphate synthase